MICPVCKRIVVRRGHTIGVHFAAVTDARPCNGSYQSAPAESPPTEDVEVVRGAEGVDVGGEA